MEIKTSEASRIAKKTVLLHTPLLFVIFHDETTDPTCESTVLRLLSLKIN